MTLFLERLFIGTTNGFTYSTLAIALVVVFRGTGTFNFAQGEMALFTTFLAWKLTELGAPVWATLFVAIAAGFAIGALVERLFIRPLIGNDMAMLIVGLGLLTAMNALDGMIYGVDSKTMPNLFPSAVTDYAGFFGARVYFDDLGVVGVVIVMLVAFYVFFQHTRLGLQMRATSINRESAALCGVRVSRAMWLGWGLAGAVGSIAGMLVAPLSANQLSLNTMFPVLIYASAAALVGGLDSVVGALIGGLIIGIVQTMVSGYVSFVGGGLNQTIAFATILIVLLVKPSGILGKGQGARV